VALFWRKVTLDEALGAVREELSALRPGQAPPTEIVELSHLLRADGGPALPGAQEIVDAILDGACLLGSRGRIAVANAALHELVGAGRCLGRTLLEITRSGEINDAAQAALAGRLGRGEFEAPSLQKVLLVTVAPLSDGRALAIFRDLTDDRRLEDVRRDFIANASHELRTPVAAISGAVETLLSGDQLVGPTGRGFVEMIARHAERLSRLTRDLLDLSRLETGEFRVEIGTVEVASLCLASIDLVRARAEKKRLVVNFDGPERLRALADRRALEQILVNLLDNAVKYTPQGGRITVLADGGASSVVISVFDTGPGIEPRHQARIFERFYRADAGRAREDGGTGLGLSIVKHLAQAQNGQVGVESGQGGSRFWVRLPAPA